MKTDQMIIDLKGYNMTSDEKATWKTACAHALEQIQEQSFSKAVQSSIRQSFEPRPYLDSSRGFHSEYGYYYVRHTDRDELELEYVFKTEDEFVQHILETAARREEHFRKDKASLTMGNNPAASMMTSFGGVIAAAGLLFTVYSYVIGEGTVLPLIAVPAGILMYLYFRSKIGE